MHTCQLRLALASVLFCVGPSVTLAQQPPNGQLDQKNVALARRLLQAMHVGDNMMAGIDAGLAQQRRENTKMSPILYDSIVARMKRSIPELLDSIAPNYARRFTSSDLEAMIRFFESPPGQSLASQEGALTLELGQFARRWGARLAAVVMKDLLDAGIDITKP